MVWFSSCQQPSLKPKMEPRVRASVVRRAPAPDGGYGWFVVLSTFLVCGLSFGVIKSFGVFFVEIHHYFTTTATATSWITSITVATIHIGSPFGAVLSECWSHRGVVMLGGLLSSVGMVAGAYADNLIHLYITVGFLTGLGYAITWTPAVTMLGWYFDRRRPLANALASTGECVLTFILTPLFQLLVDHFTWRGAMLILGGLQLNLCVCGALLRPLGRGGPVRSTQHQEEEAEEEDHERDCCEGDSGYITPLKPPLCRYVDYTLITNAHFMVYSLFGVFAAFGFFAPALFLVPYARSRGLEEYEAAMLVSLSAALDMAGRVFFGWVANLRLVPIVRQLALSVTLLAATLLLCPLADSFGSLAAFCVLYGLAYGATVSTHITVLAEVVGPESLGSALGFFMLLRSSGGLLGPPIAGFFIDKMGDYGTGFLMAGVALLVSALFLLLLDQMSRRGRGLNKDRKGSNVHDWEQEVADACKLPDVICKEDKKSLEEDV
ncbi:monocarboxylate transporter 13 [Engraulis encrasicolus]|uniref:monocarboxylate transporter 13 n=1 Tax=Engraulis encrasicolus TaxID=184585 RepID=UPI002FD309A5